MPKTKTIDSTPSAPAKVPVLLHTSGGNRFIRIYGADAVPPGALRLDVADIYPVYVVEGPLGIKIAIDIGRDK
jgi:hypothetical protein